MQHEVHYDREAGVVFVRYGEKLNKEIVLGASKELNTIPDLKKGTPVLVDFRACVDVSISSEDTREVAKFMARNHEKRGFYRIAQLVSSQFMFATSRMTTATLDPDKFEMMVFQDETEAKEWLGLPADFKLPSE